MEAARKLEGLSDVAASLCTALEKAQQQLGLLKSAPQPRGTKWDKKQNPPAAAAAAAAGGAGAAPMAKKLKTAAEQEEQRDEEVKKASRKAYGIDIAGKDSARFRPKDPKYWGHVKDNMLLVDAPAIQVNCLPPFHCHCQLPSLNTVGLCS